ncbi:NUDIX hydrolase [Plantactinospora sp. B6F1]|uniref:NUDIX hydrolase n=1 Tax=Plantactinospora sp. B6F1 TaxID=3158971 RepID=UPI0032D9AA7F
MDERPRLVEEVENPPPLTHDDLKLVKHAMRMLGRQRDHSRPMLSHLGKLTRVGLNLTVAGQDQPATGRHRADPLSILGTRILDRARRPDPPFDLRSRWDMDELRKQLGIRKEGDHMPEQATKPEPRPVVAAIVTSNLGVLVGRRNDGKPPWTFIAGEIEPGESAADAVVREVKEETGLLVRAAEREIGRRVHPKTGRTMIYLACSPVNKTDILVGNEEELAEVRWVGLQEAEELLPGLYEPVLLHLAHELGSTQ